MRAVKTILSISFLLLASSINAIDKEKFNDLPDEIRNLDKKKMLKSIEVDYVSYKSIPKTIHPEITSVIVKLKLNRDGSIDTAAVVYCEKPNIGFEESALHCALWNKFHPKLRKRRVDKSWFYTEVIFSRITLQYTAKTGDTLNPLLGSKPNDTDIATIGIMPEIIYKSVPEYPSAARGYGKVRK